MSLRDPDESDEAISIRKLFSIMFEIVTLSSLTVGLLAMTVC